ncbi:MAG: rubrerythrin family protein [Desulfobacteraceae bacterium]|jgi:rubrerythrin
MDEKIRETLHKAYTGEAKAALRLKIFAKKAEEEGYAQVAKLFRVIAFSEEIHGARALRVLQEIGSTEDNLKDSFESETKVAQVAYENFIQQALALGENQAAEHFTQSRDVEEGHANLYKSALNDLMEDRTTTYYICSVCGYISDGVLPEECPVCGAPKDQFVHFE